MTISYENLTPGLVFKYFAEISKIPRGSGNEKAISDYLVGFARERGLQVIQDKAWNVIIKKPGTSGYEKAPAVIIQGHMDMVCDKNNDTVHNFEKDPIKIRIDGDMLYAFDTTLGADDGIAVAYGLALLDSKDIPHPPLEILMTVEEEVGLCGAAVLDTQELKGRILINIDSEEDDKLLVGCAGGVRVKEYLPISWENTKAGMLPCNISIKGLIGGHSGGGIHKGRGNSNKLMGRLLNDLSQDLEYYIREINGGLKMNAIPREADAVILINPDDYSKLEANVHKWESIFKNELRVSDPGVSVNVEKLSKHIDSVFSGETAKKAVASLILMPNGVQTMSMDIAGLVESSTNLGVVITSDTDVCFESAARSSVRSLKYNILNQIKMVSDILGARFEANSDYPEWEYNPDSKLRSLFIEVYKRKYGSEPEIVMVHGGVECGLFGEKMPGIDMVSVGPNTYDVHTPKEHISISSIGKTWEYLLEVLKEIK